MKVSIVIPIYNKEDYIETCINDILSQDFDSFEIIAIDDGSTDGSRKICDNLAKKDSRVRLFHTPNSGVTAARRCGVEQAEGNYIMFVDADDTLMPHAIRKLYNLIKKTQADEVIGTFCNQHGYHSPVTHKGWANSEQLIYSIITNKNQFCVLWGIIFRKELLLDCLNIPRDIYRGEDKMMQVKFLMKKPKVFFCEECVYFYNTGLPNNRRLTLDHAILYNKILKDTLTLSENEFKNTWEIPFNIHQIKEYEDFLYYGYMDLAKKYKKTLNISLRSIPYRERIIYALSPTIGCYIVKTLKSAFKLLHFIR